MTKAAERCGYGAVAPGLRGPVWLAAAVALAVIASCGGQGGDKQPSQVAAKVNKEELSVHQINFVLQQMRGLKPEQSAEAGRQVLERLIDQELAVQRAEELKVDRDPAVMQQIDAARREILARAYGERVGQAAAKPTPEEVTAYYNATPALFKERRVYNLQELTIEAPPAQIEELRSRLAAAKSVEEFVGYLRSNDIRFRGNNAVRAAEQLPLASLDAYARLKPGDSLFNLTPSGAQVIVLADARPQPVGEEKARPAIEQFLLAERRRKLVEDEVKKLRGAAMIEYVGAFAESAATAAASAASAASAAAAATAAAASAALPLPRAEPAPLPPVVRPAPVAERPVPAASALDVDAINSGIGLKR